MINNFKVLVLLLLMSTLFMIVGNIIGGASGMTTSLLIGLVVQGIAFWNSDKIALSMNRARPLSESEQPEIHAMTRKLCSRAGLPMPRLYIIPDESPNAFATGRDPEHSAVAVTVGLLRHLNRSEIECVIAHELGHIKNRDVFVCTVAAIIAASITQIVQFGMFFGAGRNSRDGSNQLVSLILLLVAPFAALIIQMGISRTREYGADESAVQFTQNPAGLASALHKIHNILKLGRSTELNPGLSTLYFQNPFQYEFLAEMLSTHPPVHKRVKRLLAEPSEINNKF